MKYLLYGLLSKSENAIKRSYGVCPNCEMQFSWETNMVRQCANKGKQHLQ